MFNVGQKVYDIKYGWGVVRSIGTNISQPVNVDFGSSRKFYELDGKSYHTDKHRSLFFAKPEITPEMLNPPRWRAPMNTLYYFINNLGAVVKTYEMGTREDNIMFSGGNYFETEAEAKESAIYKAFERVGGVND